MLLYAICCIHYSVTSEILSFIYDNENKKRHCFWLWVSKKCLFALTDVVSKTEKDGKYENNRDVPSETLLLRKKCPTILMEQIKPFRGG